MNEELTNISLMNILASVILLCENKVEIPIEMAVSNYDDLNLAITYNEDQKTLLLELKEIKSDESRPVSE